MINNYNKKILFLLLTTLQILAFSNNITATNWTPQKNIIIRGSDNYPPFEFINKNGEADGFNIDIIKALMHELEYVNYELKLDKWDNVYRDIKENKIDIVVGMMYSRKRALDVKFGLPLCLISSCIVYRNTDNYKSLEDLRGKKIIVQEKGGGHTVILKYNTTDKIIIVPNMDEGIKLLASGVGDAIVGNELVTYYAIKKLNIKSLLVKNLSNELQRYSIAVNKDSDDLLYQLNLGIQSLKTSGKYDEIYNKWFGVLETGRLGKIFSLILGICSMLIIFLLLFLWLLRKQVKKATMLLLNSKQEIEMAIDAGKISAWSYNIQTGIISALYGKIIEDGNNIEKIFNKIHPDDLPNIKKAFKDLSSESKKRIYLCFRIKIDKNEEYSVFETIMVNVNKTHESSYRRIVGTLKDVTDEIKLKHQLEDYRLKTTFITNTNGIILMQYDTINKIFIKVNKSGENDSGKGYTRPLYLSKVHINDIEIAQRFLSEMEDGKKEHISSEFRFLDENDEYQWYTIDTVAYIYNKEGKIINYLGLRRNNTKWKKITDYLIKLKNEAEASNKLKSAFLANMSHEIRTPLNAIVGFSNLVAEADNEDDQKQFNGIIKSNSELLLQLIDDILDLSKIEAGFIDFNYKIFNFCEYFNELCATLELRKPEGIDFIFKKYNLNFNIYSDKTRMSQIITNFVTNAFKFTKHGNVTIDYKYENENLTISVTDTGIGISQENQNKIFDRFEKLNDFAQGTGLGLSICKAIAKAMDGKISIESELEKGSTFSFILPCSIIPEDYKDETSQNRERGNVITKEIYVNTSNHNYINKSSAIKLEDGKKTILIAEDIDSNFTWVNSILKDDFTVVRAKNGKEAVELYKEINPDFILMDMKMPIMDGLEATRLIREFNKTIPIIALTAYIFDTNRDIALKSGCSGFLSKPISRDSLYKELNLED